MNTLLKAISCGVILTTLSPAAEQEDPELAAAIAASLADHQSAQEAAALQESAALAASLAEHQQAQEAAVLHESAALAASLAELQRAQARDDAFLAQRNRVIATDFDLAHLLAGMEDTKEITDEDLQQALYESTLDAANDSEIAAALAFSLQIQPAQNKAILIEAAETLAESNPAKNAALKDYFTYTANLLKRELDKDAAISAGTDVQRLNLEIERLQRDKAKKAAAFSQMLNSPELIIFKNLLKIKFPDFTDIQIQDILEEIQK